MDDWQSLRNHFIRETGGDFPGGNLEATLVEAYSNNPDMVERSVEKILAGHKSGKVRSPWGALKAEVERGSDPSNNPKHDTGVTKLKLIGRAEQWIRNAGLMYDRQEELLDELFGDQGMIRHIDTPDARLHLLLLWREVRYDGERTEAEEIQRGLHHQEQHATLEREPKNDLQGRITNESLERIAQTEGT